MTRQTEQTRKVIREVGNTLNEDSMRKALRIFIATNQQLSLKEISHLCKRVIGEFSE